MNITLSTRKKMNDILNADPVRVNENFDRMSKDLLDMADALGEYQIDLTTDVTGELPVANIDTDALSTALGVDDDLVVRPLSTRRFYARQANTSGSPTASFGMTEAQYTDSNSGGASPDATTAYNLFSVPGVTGSKAGFDGPTLVRVGHEPRLRMYIETGASLAALRYWMGWSSAGHTNVDTHAAHTASFRYSTVVPDGGWVGVLRDNTTQEITSTILAIAASTRYLLTIDIVAGVVTFTVDNLSDGTTGSASLQTNLPGATTSILVSQQVFTTENVAKSWKFSRYFAEAN